MVEHQIVGQLFFQDDERAGISRVITCLPLDVFHNFIKSLHVWNPTPATRIWKWTVHSRGFLSPLMDLRQSSVSTNSHISFRPLTAMLECGGFGFT